MRSRRREIPAVAAVLVVAALLVRPAARVGGPAAIDPLPQDRGAAGAWQKIQKLRTIASVMHVTAHPDDEQGGVLARLSRGEGAQVSLLTLTRGESGDNAIGSELFDALGLIRTEELLRADQYYGVDDQYFTSAIDYGFSKRLEEALRKWGRDAVLRDVVRIMRTDRPLVVIARFQGNERDGHGNHQAAGLLAREAFRVAGDPVVFPEQIRDGLRPWQPLKLYMGGVRPNEDWTVRIDTATYSPWLGDSYANFARTGLSFQRSQNSGRTDRVTGPAYVYYKRIDSKVVAPDHEESVFDGIDVSLAGLVRAARSRADGASERLSAIEREAAGAAAAFTLQNPAAAAPALARGLAATRSALQDFGDESDVGRALAIKERQFVDALNAAMGIEFSAVAQLPSTGARGDDGPFAPPATMGPIARGDAFDVRLQLTNHGTIPLENVAMSAEPQGTGIATRTRPSSAGRPLAAGETLVEQRRITVAADAPLTQPYFSRASLEENRYTFRDGAAAFRPWNPPAFVATAAYAVNGVAVDLIVPVTRREAQPPNGYVLRELAIVPAVAVTIAPRQQIVAIANLRAFDVEVELTGNGARATNGSISLRLPDRWTAAPSSHPFALAHAGEKTRFSFRVTPSTIRTTDYTIAAVAKTDDGRTFDAGYDVIAHRDLETRHQYRAAATSVRGVDVTIPPNLSVGYVMGVGDDVPAGIAQLGANVELLTVDDLARGRLGRFDAIVTGTRAYGARPDLRTYNGRLLEYVRDGGNLVVLYNTPAEFDPSAFAPYPARLPADAEEVSEEDSPVAILAPSRPEFTRPNAITPRDFDGWVEQRGSKFFSAWDAAYTPLIETHDEGQAPQKGGWLTAAYGKGHYTYFAYALHRQLPYGVPGAYRLLANLLSLGKSGSR